LNTKSHFLQGRQVEVNQAIKKNEDTPENIKAKALKKIFVGGLTDQADRDSLYFYFSQFGEVVNAYVIYDPNTKLSKSRVGSPRFWLRRVSKTRRREQRS
jgi:RNA recognition motif-containing protein